MNNNEVKELEQHLERNNGFAKWEALKALSIINCLKAEVERLQANYTLPKKGFFNLLCGALVYTETLEEYNKFRKEIKSEARKELAERLKCGVPQETGVIRCADIDNLLAEMERERV